MPRIKKNTAAKGFVCPMCNVKMEVYKSRSRANGIIVRSRRCPQVGCTHRATTEERVRTNHQ